MIGLSAHVDGLLVFDRNFLKVEQIVDDSRPVFDAIADEWWYPEVMSGQWQSAGAAGGTPWKPLSEAYAKWKPAGTSILVLTGDMERSFTKKGAKDNVDIRERKYAIFGSIDRKVRWHHEGVPSRHLPSRQLVVVNDPRRRSLMKVAQRKYVSLMRETGLVQRTLDL